MTSLGLMVKVPKVLVGAVSVRHNDAVNQSKISLTLNPPTRMDGMLGLLAKH